MTFVGDKIRSTRLHLCLSQSQLAGKEFSRAYISLVENGRCQPSLDALRILAPRLGKRLEFFLEGNQTSEEAGNALMVTELAEKASEASHFQEAHERFKFALSLARNTDRHDLEARIQEGLGVCLAKLGMTEDALRTLEDGIDVYRLVSDRGGLARCFYHLGGIHFSLEEYVAARRCYERVLYWAQGQKSLRDLSVRALNFLGSACFREGKHADALRYYRQAIQECSPDEHPLIIGHTHMGLGWTLHCMGRLDDAIKHTKEAVALLTKVGPHASIPAQHNMALFDLAQGNAESAYAKLRQCREYYQSQAHSKREASVLEDIGHFWLLKGEINQAEASCRNALELLDREDNGIQRGRLYRLLGSIEARRNNHSRARELLQLSAELFRRLRAAGELERSLQELRGLAGSDS